MKPAFVYTALGLAFGAGGALLRPPIGKAACFYAALPCLAIATAYWLRRPRTLMKRPDGGLAPASWVLFGAFHAVNSLFLFLYRRFARAPQWHEIVPGLYLGEHLWRWDRPDWRPEPWHVLDLTAELAEATWARSAAGYLCIPLLDRTAPTAAQIEEGVAFIREHLAHGSVYVHCAYGHSRSAAFVAAYLVASGRSRTPKEAMALVQSKRPGAYLNRRQAEALRAAYPCQSG